MLNEKGRKDRDVLGKREGRGKFLKKNLVGFVKGIE